MENYKLGCVVTAAGFSKRFGGNKLLVQLNGKSIIRHTLDAIPSELFSCVAVVTQYREIAEIAEEYGFMTVFNDTPEQGISSSVKLGVCALADCDAIMFTVADQPMLKKESIRNEVNFFLLHRDNIVAAAHNGKRGNPCIFPGEFFCELKELQGDVGGSAVIKKHTDRLLLFELEKEQLADIDNKSDLLDLTFT